jgi:hypothetical protein
LADTEEPAEDTAPEIAGPAVVDVSHLRLRPDPRNHTVRYRYSLSNTHPENKAVSGYLFIVLANDQPDPPALAPHPKVELIDGAPADYQRGAQFMIRRGKTVRGEIKGLETPGQFDQAWVYAYSKDGRLLIRKKLTSIDG